LAPDRGHQIHRLPSRPIFSPDLGLGSLMAAHAPKESVPVLEVVRAAELYLNIGLSMSE
jgi:hypothetical protein